MHFRRRSDLTLPDRIRAILSSRGLSLADVSRQSRDLYAREKRFHIPANLYYLLGRQGFSPGLHQLLALSRLSDYRLVDWFAAFGIVLDDIPRLQASLPSPHTTLVDANVYDDQSAFFSFEQGRPGLPPESLRPLREWARLSVLRRTSAQKETAAPFLFARIGSQDDFAYPDLLPGSIVRIVRPDAPAFQNFPVSQKGSFFLVEHRRGLLCSRLHASRRNRIVLCPTLLPFAPAEFELGKEARILGAVDFELRPVDSGVPPGVLPRYCQFWNPAPLEPSSAPVSLDRLLRRARQRSGLSFREASAKSALVAEALEDQRFFCATGSLSDFESKTAPPRHAHKLFSLCVLYSLNFWELITSGGLDRSGEGREVMPGELLGRTVPREASPDPQDKPVLAQFPASFGRAAAELFKMDHLSVRDLFSAGDQKRSFHPYLADAVALIVDRRKKRVVTLRHLPLWAQPLYVLLQRNGHYICTSCISNTEGLVLRPFSNEFCRPLRLKSPAEIEVIGRVVGILRRTVQEQRS